MLCVLCVYVMLNGLCMVRGVVGVELAMCVMCVVGGVCVGIIYVVYIVS